MKNQVQLITYIDRLSGKGIKELEKLLVRPFKDLFGGVHVLPFYYPIDGSDADFDPGLQILILTKKKFLLSSGRDIKLYCRI